MVANKLKKIDFNSIFISLLCLSILPACSIQNSGTPQNKLAVRVGKKIENPKPVSSKTGDQKLTKKDKKSKNNSIKNINASANKDKNINNKNINTSSNMCVEITPTINNSSTSSAQVLSNQNKNLNQDKNIKKEKNKIEYNRHDPAFKALSKEEQKAIKKEYKEKNKHKAFRDLGYDELMVGKNKMLAEGRKDAAIKHLEKMIPLCNNIEELRDLSLEVADLVFDEGDLKQSENLYSQFCQSYPGDKNIEYASYRAILCNYWLTLDKERDQSHTKTTISLAKSFLDRSEVFKDYKPDVEKILADCNDRLLESEVSIFKEYLNLGDQLSAKTRLACIEKEYSENIDDIEPTLITLSCEYASKFNDQNLLLAKQKELKEKYPDFIKDQPFLVADTDKTLSVNKQANQELISAINTDVQVTEKIDNKNSDKKTKTQLKSIKVAENKTLSKSDKKLLDRA